MTSAPTDMPMTDERGHFPTTRIARATANLDAMAAFYVAALGLGILYRFADHDGFDGLIIGKAGAPLHLEFTTGPHGAPTRKPDPDDLIIFYLGSQAAVERIATRLKEHGFQPVAAINPYWDRQGVTFEDPDGFRVVLQGALWPM